MLSRSGSLLRCSGANGNGSNDVTLESYTLPIFPCSRYDLAQVRADLDPTTRPLDERAIEAGERGDPVDDPRTSACGSERPRSRSAGVVAARVRDDRRHRLGRQLMLPLQIRGGDRRQRHDPRNRREIVLSSIGRIEVRRDGHDAVHRHADLRLQVVRDPRHAVAAVALANQVFARREAMVLHQPVEDDAREVVDVVVGGVEILLRLIGGYERPAEAGADRIDEDEIGEVEPRARIVGERCRIRRAVALIAEGDVLGSDRAEVQVHRRRAGAAVERDRHRPVGPTYHERGEDDFASFLGVGTGHRNRADGRGVLQRPAIQLHRLIDVRIWRQRRERFFRFVGRLVGRLGRGRLGLLREQSGRQQECDRKRASGGRLQAAGSVAATHRQTAYRKRRRSGRLAAAVTASCSTRNADAFAALSLDSADDEGRDVRLELAVRQGFEPYDRVFLTW